MKSIFILLLSLAFSCSSLAGVGLKDLNEIRALAKAGEFEKALDGHLWFHEESKSSGALAGVRLSFAIGDWIDLGTQYPPALEALIQIRDKDKQVLLSGSGDFSNFHDLSAINSALGEQEATLDLFFALENSYPEQAGAYYIVAEALLIEHKRYDICAKYIGDPVLKYEEVRNSREVSLSLVRSNDVASDSNFKEIVDQSYLDDVVKLIEVSIAVDKREEALEIQKRASTYFSDDSIRNAI